VTRTARLLALALAFALAPATACKREERAPAAAVAPLPALDARMDPLRSRFDAEAAGPRILVLASPT
jgi:hypothetical protein